MIIKILISITLIFNRIRKREKHKSYWNKNYFFDNIRSTLFAIISIYSFHADQSRVIAQIVSGIGFLSAGVIFKNSDQITGLTTASIWCAAAVGVLVGIGMFEIAVISTLSILIINTLFTYFKNE